MTSFLLNILIKTFQAFQTSDQATHYQFSAPSYTPPPNQNCSGFRYLHQCPPKQGCINSKVSRGAKIRNRYNQVPHLTQDTNGKVTKSHLDTTNESQEVNPFPADDHKAHINRGIQMHSKHKTENTLKIHKRSTALERSVKYFTGGLKPVLRCTNLTLSSDMDKDT